MKNITSYNEFIKEALVFSKFSFLFRKLYKIIDMIPPSSIIKNAGTYHERYTFKYSPVVNNYENDPFHEEEYDTDINVELHKDTTPTVYRCMINNEQIPLSYLEIRILFLKIRTRKTSQAKIEKKNKEADLYKKYKDLDKYL